MDAGIGTIGKISRQSRVQYAGHAGIFEEGHSPCTHTQTFMMIALSHPLSKVRYTQDNRVQSNSNNGIIIIPAKDQPTNQQQWS